LARLGGDEFTILLDDIRDPIEAVRVAERIQAELAIPFVINKQEIVISASIGIASSTSPHIQAEDLVRDADIAMYRAKRAGKARCEVSDTAMHANAVKRLKLETDLRKAFDRGEFRVYYQPIVSLQTGKITGFEALTRWQRPDGILSPIEFHCSR
jgi:predicted signal transduction protein with EAL and GGDEF domain